MKDAPVLVVDFDGCYVRNDFFAEQFIRRTVENPFFPLLHFIVKRRSLLDVKKELLSRLQIKYPATQLVNSAVQQFISENRKAYSRVVLVSASPDEFVKRFLADDPTFDEVRGSVNTNLKAGSKLAFINQQYGNNFHYIGHSKDDEIILRSAVKGFRLNKNEIRAL